MDNSAIIKGIKEALVEGQSTVNLREASALTGSGSGVGGRVIDRKSTRLNSSH